MTQMQPHILLITYPAQGHINPSLRFAERLVRLGVKVTFSITVSAYRRMSKAGPVSDILNFAVFSDGFDDGFNSNTDELGVFYTQLRIKGKESLKETILLNAKNGTPVSCLVYTILLPWAAEVARDLHVPSAFLWIQPASVLRVYYYYFNGYEKLIKDCIESSGCIQLTGLPLFKSRDLPSFCYPGDPYGPVMDLIKEHFEMLDLEEKPKILVNSFDELENEALDEIEGKLKLVAVGPLIPSAFLDGQDSIDKSFKGDLFETSKDYLEWMNTKPEGSIIYISFGSLLVFSNKQKEAMARALLACGRPFLWVIRDGDKGNEEEVSCMEKLGELGLIVPWCSQLEVLSHPSLGCFVSHCGWNSTLESIVCGVPVVAFPQWTDQTTNAKLLEDVWGTGVRVTSNEDGVVESEEIRRCVETVMGGCDGESTMRKNTKKWKDLGREAMKETGSSYMNLKAFIQELNDSKSNVESEIVSTI
ncbi:UDP-glycosyltransferase 75C1-like [Rutidosis leptorrhynchoides]|uniref:UDP-glycosyltransferase 75C1-like n=1 Tax=Rutidosis leptorrhynchoides TaxID=125765 RepID=UPI003A99891A